MSGHEFDRLWEIAVEKYLDSTNRSEAEQAVLKEIKTFEQLKAKLERDHGNFEGFRNKGATIAGNLKNFTQPLSALSAVGSTAIGLSPFAPASTIFGAVCLLVNAGKNVSQAYDWIDELFDRLGNFTVRLDEYCTEGVLAPLGSKVVQIFGCLLEILARCEKAIKTGRFKRYLKEVAGFLRADDDIKASFDKLAELFNNEQGLVLAITYTTSQRLDKRTEEIEKTGQETLRAVKMTESAVNKMGATEQKAEQHRLRQEILEWLSTTDYPAVQKDYIRRRQEDTGLWFLREPKFRTWIDTRNQTLFCTGMKGAGKTIIAATVIDHLSSTRTNDVGLAYIFYNYKLVDQSAQTILSAIFKQLVRGLPDVPESVVQFYRKFSKQDRRPHVDDILTALDTVFNSYAHSHVVVDALDECNRLDRDNVIRKLGDLQRTSDIRLLVTSRDIPEITELFRSAPSLEVRASDDDLRRYVARQISSLAMCIRNSELTEDVINKVVKAADGMFLIAELHVKSLHPPLKPSQVHSILERLTSATLDEAYAGAMIRIDQQEPNAKSLAWRALSWINHAKRQLTTRELCHVLSLEPESTAVGDDDCYDIDEVVSVCGGLVEIDRNIDVVRLKHYTLQEYLKALMWQTYSDVDVALDCVAYLALQPFQSGSCSDGQPLRQRLRENAFLRYAALYWSDHVRPLQNESKNAVITFLRSDPLIDSLTQVATYIGPPKPRGFRQFPRKRNGLHLTAMYGLEDLMKLLIHDYAQNKNDVDSADGWGRTPLSLASEYGQENIVALLLLTENVDINSVDKGWKTPLIHAAASGNLGVVNLLLKRNAYVEWKSIDSHLYPVPATPLWYAATEGHEAVVERLLDPDITVEVDVESRGPVGRTPFAIAASHGHLGIMNRLLATGKVNTKARDELGETALHVAASDGHEDAVRLLLDAASDPDAENNDKETPLLKAAQHGHEGIVQMLLDTGRVDPNSRSYSGDTVGQTPLFAAVERGYDNIVKQLLATDQIIPDLMSRGGRTPLWIAAYHGFRDIVEMLLDPCLVNHGKVDPDAKDESGSTPLRVAVIVEREEVTKLFLDDRLVDTGKVNPDSVDIYGWTPLYSATQNGDEENVKLLLDKRLVDTGKVNPDAMTVDGETSLFRAATNGPHAIVKLLLNTGKVKPNVVCCGLTPLWIATYNSQEEIVELLLGKDLLDRGDLDPDEKCEDQTPLWVAADHGAEGIVKLLLETGKVDPDTQDKNGETPLRRAVERGHVGIARMLLRTGNANPKFPDKLGDSPWSRASALELDEIVNLMESVPGVVERSGI